jgi:hypothetical protein
MRFVQKEFAVARCSFGILINRDEIRTRRCRVRTVALLDQRYRWDAVFGLAALRSESAHMLRNHPENCALPFSLIPPRGPTSFTPISVRALLSRVECSCQGAEPH